jgi:hypothetical protein
MKIACYRELSDTVDFFNFLKTQSGETEQPASVNLWSDDWIKATHTLPYILTNTKRFDGTNGEFFILYDKDKIIACSGIYISDFNKDIAIAGVRTWISKGYRHLSLNKDYLLVEHKKWATNKNIKMIALSFNEYNKNIIQIFKRNRLGEKTGRIANREPHNMFYNGLHEVNFPVTIQYTPQWVIYEKIDNAFDFDWSSIKWKE